jgi:hypothetical protein
MEEQIQSTESAQGNTEILMATQVLRAAYTQLSGAFPETILQAERHRLKGAGTKRYGFIDRIMDYSGEYPQFVTAAFSRTRLTQAMRNIEQFRDAQIAAEMMLQLINDQLLMAGETAFNEALLYYDSVKALAKRNVPGAPELYEQLKPLFTRTRNPEIADDTQGGNPPTIDSEDKEING